VLITNDRPDTRAYVHKVLGRDWEIEAVGDGRSVLDAARARVPDLVIADVTMRDLDWHALVRTLQESARRRPVPLLLLPSPSAPHAGVDEAGADFYLITPMSGRELAAKVETLATLASDRARVAAEPTAVEAGAPPRGRDLFPAALTHEMRQPMGAVMGWIRRLQSSGADAALRAPELEALERNLRTLTRFADQLLEVAAVMSEKLRLAAELSRLIGDVRDIAAVMSGKLSLALETLEPAQPLARALTAVRPAAAANDVELALKAAAEVPKILGDADRLQQVFSNLLTNTVRFAGVGGRVTVALDCAGDFVQIQVRNAGPNTDPARLLRVFGRVDQPATPRLGELGLILAGTIIQLHGGTISTEGAGSTVTVRLPIASGCASDSGATGPTAP
jgi:signal transduction histidine kinase